MAHSKALEVPAVEERQESPAAKALRARILRDELTEEDKHNLARATAIIDGRAAGLAMKTIAEQLGEPRTTVAQFARLGIFRVWHEHLTQLEVTEDEAAAEEKVQKTRTALKSMSGHVREYVAWAARKRADGKGYEDEGAAMWAAQYLAKSTGVDTPERASRPTINVHIETIQAVSASIKRDSDAALKAAGRVIDAVVTAAAADDALEMENGA